MNITIRLLLATMAFSVVATFGKAEEVSFRSQIAPILFDNCLACHGPKKAEGGYRLDTFDEMLKAGDSGEQPVIANMPADSELLRRLITDDHSIRMPAESDALSPVEIELISRWISAGATFDGAQASEPLLTVIPPLVYPTPPGSYSRPVPITAIAFSPDQSFVITGGYHELMVWNASDGKLVRRISNLAQSVFAMTFLPDAKTLVVACGDPGIRGEVRLFDFESGRLLGVVARSADVILDVAPRPQSTQLAACGADGMIRIVKTDDYTEVRTIASHADWVTAVAWSDDGTRLASSSRDKSAKVYDSETGQLLISYTGHGMPVRNVLFASDGKSLLSTSSDSQLHRWSITDGAKIAGVGVGSDPFQMSRVGEGVWVTSTDRHIRLFDCATNAVTKTLAGHQDWVASIAVSVDGKRVASGSMDGEVRLWNAEDGTVIGQWLAKP